MPKFIHLIEAARTMGELRNGDAKYVLDLWKQSDECRAAETLDKILTDPNYEGGVQFWIQKHDKLLAAFGGMLESEPPQITTTST